MIPNPSPDHPRAGKNGNGAGPNAIEPSDAYLTAVATYEAAAAERRTLSPVYEAQLVAGLSSREIARLAQAKQVIERLYAARSSTPRGESKGDTDPPLVDKAETLPVVAHGGSPVNEPTPAVVRPSSGIASTRLGRFEIVREIGRGGHGVVFLARDPVLGRQVALKTPRPEMLLTPQMKRRFLREGKAAALLNHPNLLTVFEAGEAGPICWLAQAYCPGVTLAAWLREQAGPIEPRMAARIIAELAAGVEHAHSRGVLHRDIKPSNVLLEPRQASSEPAQATAAAAPAHRTTAADEKLPFTPKLTDFGLAKVLEPDAEHTATGTTLGTPAYMPPEQAAGRGDQIGPAADVYGLGAILYELLTGRLLFAGHSHVETLHKVVMEEPAAPRSLVPRLPRDLEAICLRCLEKEPQRRYPTAQQLADDLGRFLRGEPTLARPIGLAERTAKWLRRHPVRVLVLLLMATVVAAGAWGRRAYDQHQAVLAREAETAIRHEADSIHERYPREAQAAHAALVRLNYAEAREHLLRCEPKLSQAAPTGFTWEFLRSQAAPDHRVLRGHVGNVYGVAYSPDGSWLASGGADATLRLWDVEKAQLVAALEGHTGDVNAVSVSPDGRWIASAGDDRTVKISDAAARSLHKTLSDATDAVGNVAFSPDGRELATGSHDKTLRVYDTESWQIVCSHQPHHDWIESVAFAPHEPYLISTDTQGGLAGWHTSPWQNFYNNPSAGQRRLVFSHRSRAQAFVVEGKEIEIWDGTIGDRLPRFIGHRERINALAFTADDATLISASRDATLRIWDVDSQFCKCTLELDGGEAWSVAASSTDRQCAVGCADGTVHLVNLAGFYDRRRLRGLPAPIEAMAMDRSGRLLSTATNEAEIFVWDTTAWNLLYTVHVPHGHVRGLALSSDGRYLAATTGVQDDGVALVQDLQTGSLVRKAIPRSLVGRLYFTANDQRLLVAEGQGLACLNRQLESAETPVPAAMTNVNASALSPDGRWFAAGLSDKAVEVYDLTTGLRAAALEGLWEQTAAVAVSEDGRLAAAGNILGHVAIWNVSSGDVLAYFEAHSGSVRQLAFHPSGLELASVGNDGQGRVWRVADRALLLSQDVGMPEVDGTLFSPDGRQLLVTARANSDAGSVHIWQLPGGDPLPPATVAQRALADIPISDATRKLLAWQHDRHDGPPSIDRFMRYLQWWAVEQGYGAALPTFRYSGQDGTLLVEVVLLSKDHVRYVQIEAENAKVDQGKEFPDMIRRADAYAREHNAVGGLIDFGRTRPAPHPDWHYLLFDSAAVERREVPASELDDAESSPRHRIRLLSAWAIRHGYLGAFPTWDDREEDGQEILGALCIKPGAGLRSWFVMTE